MGAKKFTFLQTYHIGRILSETQGLAGLIYVAIMMTIISGFAFYNTGVQQTSVEIRAKSWKSLSIGEATAISVVNGITRLLEDHSCLKPAADTFPLKKFLTEVKDWRKTPDDLQITYQNPKAYGTNGNQYSASGNYNCIFKTPNDSLKHIKNITTKLSLQYDRENAKNPREISIEITGETIRLNREREEKPDGTIVNSQKHRNRSFRLSEQRMIQIMPFHHFGFIFNNPTGTDDIIKTGNDSTNPKITFDSQVYLINDNHNESVDITKFAGSSFPTKNEITFQKTLMTNQSYFDISNITVDDFHKHFIGGIATNKLSKEDRTSKLSAFLPKNFDLDNRRSATCPDLSKPNPNPNGPTEGVPRIRDSPPTPPPDPCGNYEPNEVDTIKFGSHDSNPPFSNSCDLDVPIVHFSSRRITLLAPDTDENTIDFCGLIKTDNTLTIEGLEGGKEYTFYGIFIAKQLEIKGGNQHTTVKFKSIKGSPAYSKFKQKNPFSTIFFHYLLGRHAKSRGLLSISQSDISGLFATPPNPAHNYFEVSKGTITKIKNPAKIKNSEKKNEREPYDAENIYWVY